MKHHIHVWHYNEAKEHIINRTTVWKVLRFCPLCKETEYVELKTPTD